MYRYLPLAILHLCMKSVHWKLLKLSCRNQSVEKVHLWPWRLDPKVYMYFPLAILHLCMKYILHLCMKSVHWKLLKLSKVLTKFSCDLDLWIPNCIGIFLSPSCIYVWNMNAVHWKLVKLSCQNQSNDKVQLWPWPFDPKMYRYLPLTILHLCMKYESCKLKTSQVIVSEPKCWQSSIVTSTFDLLTPKCIGIFLLRSCIYVWNMKAVHWKLLKLSFQNQRVDKVQLWPWPLDPKVYRYLPLAILHLCMKYDCCILKTIQVIESEPKCRHVNLWWQKRGRFTPPKR